MRRRRNPRNRSLPRLSAAQWIRVGIILAGSLSLAYFAAGNALGNVGSVKRLPLLPSALNGHDLVELRVAEIDFFGDLASSDPKPLEAAARSALAREPLNSRALRDLAYVAAKDGREDLSQRLIDISLQTSRRDVLAHLYKGGLEIQQGRYDDAMRRFDHAMRVSIAGRRVIGSLILSELPNPKFRAALERYIKPANRWLPDLLDLQAQTNANLAPLARAIVSAGGLPRSQEYHQRQSRLLATLLVQREFDLAHRLYLSSHGADPAVVTSPAITNASTDDNLAPLTWVRANTAQANVTPIARGGKGINAFAIRSDTTVPQYSLQKYLFLPPGRYRWQGQIETDGPGEGTTLEWTIACLTKQATRILATERVAVTGNRSFAFDFAVSECAAVLASANLTGSDAYMELSNLGLARTG